MTSTATDRNQKHFIDTATEFFQTIFEPSLNAGYGEIEIRTFPKNKPSQQFFCKSESEAALTAGNLCNNGIDVYFGVNPRTGGGGKKENVHYLAAFHAEVDYGGDGHKKKGVYQTYDEALSGIDGFSMKPTIVNHSGGGFHCYWVLNTPLGVEKMGLKLLESVNKALLRHMGGDDGTHDISRVLRVPGTFNFKLPDNPREVVSLWMDGPKYEFEDFQWLIEDQQRHDSHIHHQFSKTIQ